MDKCLKITLVVVLVVVIGLLLFWVASGSNFFMTNGQPKNVVTVTVTAAEPTPPVTPTATPTTSVSTTATPSPTANYTGESYLRITSPANEASTHEEPITFTGEVSPNTQSIFVTAAGEGYTDTNYQLKNYTAGSTSFTYKAGTEFNNLTFGTNDYTFTANYSNGLQKSTKVTIFFVDGGAEMGKPVIYLYPKKTESVYVNVQPQNGVTISEPALNNGWQVVATPDGQILNLADQKNYEYLFWEGLSKDLRSPQAGFVMAQNEVAKFFSEKLAVLGLNEAEIADCKDFWVPKFQDKPYYFITFVPQADLDKYAPLTVKPQPDSVIRVFFDYRGLDKPINVPEQKLVTPARTGFVLVEWGGRLYR